MGFADVWNRTLVYFGIAEEEDWDEDGYVTEEAERTHSERPNVRRLTPRHRGAELDEWSEPESPRQRGVKLRPATRLRGVESPEVAAENGISPAGCSEWPTRSSYSRPTRTGLSRRTRPYDRARFLQSGLRVSPVRDKPK